MPGLVPGMHVLTDSKKKAVDGREIGERKRRRPSGGYGPAMTRSGLCPFMSAVSAPYSRHGEESGHSQKAQNPEIQSPPSRSATDRAGAGGTAQARDQPGRKRHGLGDRPAAAAG